MKIQNEAVLFKKKWNYNSRTENVIIWMRIIYTTNKQKYSDWTITKNNAL